MSLDRFCLDRASGGSVDAREQCIRALVVDRVASVRRLQRRHGVLRVFQRLVGATLLDQRTSQHDSRDSGRWIREDTLI